MADAVGRLEDKKQNLLKVADQGRTERRIAASSNHRGFLEGAWFSSALNFFVTTRRKVHSTADTHAASYASGCMG